MSHPHKVFRFGDCALDCAQRRLLRGALDIYLPPKTFELLVYLIQNRGRVIEKEELLDTIWSGVNVTENTLAQRIREVREALQDDGSTARLIKTIPRVGYQFVGHVEEEDHSPRERLDVAPKPRVTRAMWPYVVGVGALSVAGMVVAFALSRVDAPIVLANQLLVSGFPATLRDPSLSPDGGTMAFVDDDSTVGRRYGSRV